MRNSHHSLIFTLRTAFPLFVTRSPNWPSGLSPPLSLHIVPFSIKHQEICKHSGSKKAQATSLCVRHRAIHRNCIFKVPVNVRWGSEQNDWLPVSPREHYLEQKNLIIKPLTQTQSELMASYNYELKPSATFILSLQVPRRYTWLTGLRSRGCSFVSYPHSGLWVGFWALEGISLQKLKNLAYWV